MYEIKVLRSDEFDQVAKSDPRYSYVDDSNLGFADRERGTAYVRDTAIHDLNKYLINHELEELDSDESTHEDPNGIRHKKFFKDLVLPILSGGLIQPEAPQRAAAQTTNVPGVGNVPNSQAGMFSMMQNIPNIPNTPSFGIRSAVQNGGGFSGGLTGGSYPAGGMQLGGSLGGSTQGGQLGGGLGGGFGLSGPSQDLGDRVRGFYAGRLSF